MALANVTDWDGKASYGPGATVRYWGKYFRAQRDITVPFFLFSNDTPDSSADWVETSPSQLFGHGGHGGGGHGGGHHGGGGRGGRGGFRGGWGGGGWGWGDPYYVVDPLCDAIGPNGECITYPRSVIIGDDTEKFARAMHERWANLNSIKQMPVGVARILLSGAQQAYNQAASIIAAANLPRPAGFVNTGGKLKWHTDTLATMTDPQAVYAPGNDLKQWVSEAYTALDVADYGASRAGWSTTWSKVADYVAALPKAIAAQVGNVLATAETAAKWGLGITLGVVGLLGYAAYKIVTSETGKRVAGDVATTYLTGGMGGRR